MTATSRQPALEQSYISMLYRRLDELREITRKRLGEVRRSGPSGSPQNRSERDAFAALYEDRLAQLESVEDRLCFGRLDLEDKSFRYIGRIGLSNDEHDQLLTDWRAPAAEAFYQATPAHRMGVVRRRHILTSTRQVVDIEDDVLNIDALDEGARAELTGEGALMAALGAHRTGRMSDIVPTIQAEQDAIIRADLDGVLVVQGGPGTGKTAVALHRAAYLLYAHRQRLERSGVLLVGPNQRFLNYIDQVLPSLGETGAVTTSMGDLLPGITTDRRDSPEVAELKGAATMAKVVQRAVRDRQRIPDEDVTLLFDGTELRLTRTMFALARDRARKTHRPHNEARVTFVRMLLGELADQMVASLDYDVDAAERNEFVNDLRQMREVRIALNLAWMPLSPKKVIEDLYAVPVRLVAAAPDLTDEERALLRRKRGSSWTVSDIPLLDEAAELLGEDQQAALQQAHVEAARSAAELSFARDVLESSGNSMVSAEDLAFRFTPSGPRLTTAEQAMLDRSWTYGHVVVDEAQELSAMDWRCLMRRCPTRSMTVVGDIAQTTTSGGSMSWAARFNPLFSPQGWRSAELSINYRTPGKVMEVASAVATAAGLNVRVPRSVRDVDRAVILDTPDLHMMHSIVEAALDEYAIIRPGTLAIITPPHLISPIEQALATEHSAIEALQEEKITVLTANQAKGLEFDTVILVEPNTILADFSGASQLYVAMSRPTHTLRVIHSAILPEGFASKQT